MYLNKHGRLSGGTVVPTIASNFGLVKSLELAGLSAVTSGVGDRHVYAKIRGRLQPGWRADGPYDLWRYRAHGRRHYDLAARDGSDSRAERETLSQLTAPCKLLPQAQVAVRVADKDAALENMGVQKPSPRPRLRWQVRAACSYARAEPSL